MGGCAVGGCAVGSSGREARRLTAIVRPLTPAGGRFRETCRGAAGSGGEPGKCFGRSGLRRCHHSWPAPQLGRGGAVCLPLLFTGRRASGTPGGRFRTRNHFLSSPSLRRSDSEAGSCYDPLTSRHFRFVGLTAYDLWINSKKSPFPKF